MKSTTVLRNNQSRLGLEAAAELIIRTQKPNGEIPWSIGGKTDPWDHVEAAIGLIVAGRRHEAEKAFEWLAGRQLEDGSWYASYIDGAPDDRTRDANMSSYLAVGLMHHYLVYSDVQFIKKMWPATAAGLDFALSLQAAGGEIHWAASPEGVVDPMALLTGSSSIYMSLKCALVLAGVLDEDRVEWREALKKLGYAIEYRRHHFNMTKSRFSMDWFYPILCGAVGGVNAKRRIEKYWDRFIVEGLGVRCVSDEPWVTIAESSELVIALAAMGNTEQARIVFNWIQDRTFEDGSYWSGFTFPDMVVWPEDKLTWTNAAVLMAADSLYQLTPAGRLFHHDFWNAAPYSEIFE